MSFKKKWSRYAIYFVAPAIITLSVLWQFSPFHHHKRDLLSPSVTNKFDDLQKHDQDDNFSCLECDLNSIPRAGFQESDDPVAYRSLQVDAYGRYCANCKFGAFEQNKNNAIDESTTAVATSRQIILQKKYSCIYLVGSSVQRQMFINLVESFRRNHNFTHHHLIEHYFHQNARYVWNGTHDGLFIMENYSPYSSQEYEELIITNSTVFVQFIWDPQLHRVEQQQDYSCGNGGKKLLVLGNHFWDYRFHDGCKMTINKFLQQSREGDSLVWLDAWNRKNTLFSELKPWENTTNADLLLNREATEWFTENLNNLNNSQFHQISLDDILERDYGKEMASKIFRGYKLFEDKMHVQCNFRARYPAQIRRIFDHKRQRLGNCTDLINDLLWNEIYNLLP